MSTTGRHGENYPVKCGPVSGRGPRREGIPLRRHETDARRRTKVLGGGRKARCADAPREPTVATSQRAEEGPPGLQPTCAFANVSSVAGGCRPNLWSPPPVRAPKVSMSCFPAVRRLFESDERSSSVQSGGTRSLVPAPGAPSQASSTSNAARLRASLLNSTPIRWIGSPRSRYLSA